MLGGRFVHLVLHLEHDGDILGVIFCVTEDEVALRTAGGVIVFLEIGIREHRPHFAIEHVAAVGLQGFADHLGRQSSLEIFEPLNFLVGNTQAGFIVVLQPFLSYGCLRLGNLQFPLVVVYNALLSQCRFRSRELGL